MKLDIIMGLIGASCSLLLFATLERGQLFEGAGSSPEVHEGREILPLVCEGQVSRVIGGNIYTEYYKFEDVDLTFTSSVDTGRVKIINFSSYSYDGENVVGRFELRWDSELQGYVFR